MSTTNKKNIQNNSVLNSKKILQNNFSSSNFVLDNLKNETIIQNNCTQEEKQKITPICNKSALSIDSLIFTSNSGKNLTKKHNKNFIKILSDLKKLLPKFSSNIKNEQVKAQNLNETNNKKTILEIILGGVDYNTIEIHQIFNKPPEKRTFKDLTKLIKYLIGTNYFIHFLKDKLNQESIDKMLVFCSIEMKIKNYSSKTELFEIGDIPDNFYLIFNGKIEILKPVLNQQYMNGYNYFYHLMYLRKNKEIYIYNLTISENQSAFPIKPSNINNIHWIYLSMMLNLLYSGTAINFEEVLYICGISKEQLGINSTENNQQLLSYLLSHKHSLAKYIPKFTEDIFHYYSYLKANVKQEYNKPKLVNLYELKPISILEDGYHIGEFNLDDKTIQKGLIRTQTEANLLYIDANIYDQIFSKEKQTTIEQEMIYLHQTFFFVEVNFQIFEKKYFNYFIIEDKYQGELLCSENHLINDIYFIHKGIISLYSKKSPIEIHDVLITLAQNISDDRIQKEPNYSSLKSNIRELKKELLKKRFQRLFDVNNSEIIGLESFFFDIPCFVTAVIKSKRAKVIKISCDNLRKIFKEDNRVFIKAKNLIDEKIIMWYNRFFNINNVNLTAIDKRKFNKKSHVAEENYNKKEREKLIQLRSVVKILNGTKRRYEKNNSTLISVKRTEFDLSKIKLLPSLSDSKLKRQESKNQSFSRKRNEINQSTSYDGSFFLAQNKEYFPENNKKQDNSQLIKSLFENKRLEKIREITNNNHLTLDSEKIQEETNKIIGLDSSMKPIIINDNTNCENINKKKNFEIIQFKGKKPLCEKHKLSSSINLKKTILGREQDISKGKKQKKAFNKLFNYSERILKNDKKSLGEIKMHELSFNVTSSLPKSISKTLKWRKKFNVQI